MYDLVTLPLYWRGHVPTVLHPPRPMFRFIVLNESSLQGQRATDISLSKIKVLSLLQSGVLSWRWYSSKVVTTARKGLPNFVPCHAMPAKLLRALTNFYDSSHDWLVIRGNSTVIFFVKILKLIFLKIG